MLYKQTPTLDLDLFRAPTAAYRGTPFWAWNCRLEKEELLWQIDVLRKMGFGGFHMHSRAGMATPYLSEEFMDLIRACTDKAKKENMLAWLYDEDRWPSGSAGGLVTKNPVHRSKLIRFTQNRNEGAVCPEIGHREGLPYFLAAYDVAFDEENRMVACRRIGEDDAAMGEKFYVYLETQQPSGWYNGQAYVDTLSPEAMREFIRITYDAYEKAVGDEFDKTVPAIFTDEPQFVRKSVRAFSAGREDICLPFTSDFAQTYLEAYGEDLLDFLPELFYERADGIYPRARYRYHDHVTERFSQAFSDQCGAWCDAHGLALTGHMMEEPTLHSQTGAIGEAMRAYRGFTIPGIDMLAYRIEFATAKQAQSAVHQFGREAMMSELYGVTGWRFDFRGHKFQGDWQAALGVTVRVPHLSWVSMKGSAKRDYPASINYQSPWWEEYPRIEDHFARVATVMSRGKPRVRVGVIHPIESYWLTYGPQDKTAAVREEMEAAFDKLTKCLLFGTIDFDFISESLLPEQYKASDNKHFTVGEMAYDAIVVPQMLTMRSTTLARLSEFANRGGKLIFIGDAPTYLDASPSHDADALYARSLRVPDAAAKLLALLEPERDLRVQNDRGANASCFLYQMRQEGDSRYLFLAWGKEEAHIDTAPVRKYTLTIDGAWTPTLLDTQNGEEKPISYEVRGSKTVLTVPLGFSDSLLLRLAPPSAPSLSLPVKAYHPASSIDFKSAVPFRRTEDNVMILDLAEWSEDGTVFHPVEEILRIDSALRRVYGYPMADGHCEQPWVIPDKAPEHFPVLRFTFESEQAFLTALACEEASEITLNGVTVPIVRDGYYVDKSISRIAIPPLAIGKNVLTVKAPITGRISLENMFLLGDFDVVLSGSDKILRAPRREIGFGSIVSQGMPFYGGNLVYEAEFETDAVTDLVIRVSQYRGTMMRLTLDGEDLGALIYSPYEKVAADVPAGKHKLEILLYTNRQNTFGPIHNCEPLIPYESPRCWYSTGTQFSYEYRLRDLGVLISPVIGVCPKA